MVTPSTLAPVGLSLALGFGAALCIGPRWARRLRSSVRLKTNEGRPAREAAVRADLNAILSAAVEQSPAAILMTDPKGAIQYVNPKFTEITGYTFEEVKGKNPSILKSGQTPDSVYRDLWATIRSGRVWRGEVRNRRKSGEFYWDRVSISPLLDRAGSVTHFLAVQEDITASKRAETALRESQFLLSKSQEVAHVGAYRFDVAGGLWEGTAELDRIFGIGESYPRTVDGWLALIAPEQRGEMKDYLTRHVIEGKGRFEKEYRIIRPGTGEPRWVSGMGELELDSSGRPMLMVGTIQDVTEHKQFEERLLRSQRLESIGTLAGGIAHDLNNILTPMLMGVPLLRSKLEADSDAQLLLDSMESAVKRGAQVIRQILVFSRGSGGARQSLQTRRIVREVAEISEQTFPKMIAVQAKLPRDLRPVMGDSTQLHQVFMNLCVNARDAMPNGGTLTLTGENVELTPEDVARMPEMRPGPYVVWTVADTGVGIRPDLLPRIFEPFFTTKDIGKGTGLGLPTALGIVRSHGGFIDVATREKSGTAFRVYLPSIGEIESPPAAAESPAAPAGRGETILLVDDEFSIRQMAEHILTSCGYRVIAADNGFKALEVFRDRSAEIALVVTDLIMPGMKGEELIRVLRGINSNLKVVAMSGYVERATDGSSPIEVLADAFLTKPFRIGDFLRTIHEVLCAPA